MKLNKILALILVLATVLVFAAACGDGKKGKENNDGTNTGVNSPNNEVILPEAEAVPFADFVIVRGEAADEGTVDIAMDIRKQIAALAGKMPPLNTDKKGESQKEILIGNTNRQKASGLLRSQFSISYNGGKLAILAGSSEALAKGVEYFIKNLSSKSGILCGEGYLYTSPRGEYKLDSISIGGKKLELISVYDGFENEVQREIALKAIEEAAGVPCELTDAQDKATLVFTSDSAAYGLTDEDWGVITKNGVLYIVASSEYGKQDVSAYIQTIMSSASGDFSFSDKIAKVMTKEEFLKQDSLVILPEYPEQLRRNYDYKVTVSQGDKSAQIPVYNHTMEYDLQDRGAGGDMYRRFSQFAFSGAQVRVDIKVGRDFSSYTVIPSAKSFKTEYNDGVISVFLDSPEYFAVRLDNDDNSIISVFADAPEFYRELPSKDDPDVIYVEGWYEVDKGVLDFDSKTKDKTVYIAPGAVLNARVNFQFGSKNCKVLGLGAIVDPFENLYEYDITYGGSEGGHPMVKLYGYDHLYDGPVILDARNFNICGCGDNITVRNAKILSTMMTTDGVSFFNGNNYDVDHCFIYCGDNAIVYSTGDAAGKGSVNYNDITIGTTCAAIFPQGNTNDAVISNIYVFRADSAIINNTLGSDGASHELTLTNLDAVDCTYTPAFFNSYKLGSAEKTYKFENISLPDTLGIKRGQNIAGQTPDYLLVALINKPDYIYSDNYSVEMKNIYIAGAPIESLDDANITNDGSANKITLANDGAYTPAVLNRHEVNYDFKGNVYIGQRLLSFKYDTIVDGNDFYLSADEIAEYLRTDSTLTTVDKNGAKYVKASDLVSSGAAENIETADGDLYITPVIPEGNLLLPDEGEISYFSEETCFNVDLLATVEDGETTFTLLSFRDLHGGGISRKITNEVKMYGAGTYKLRFEVRGSIASTLKFGYIRDDADTELKRTISDISIDTRWDEVELDIVVTETDVACDSVTFYVKMGGDSALNSFEIRGIELIKAE